ncbi:MAG: RluA family pseudouridine synthase [Turicibacter sp.]|nr:RluA family pseudouridine synthase [Turicibacter sp.]
MLASVKDGRLLFKADTPQTVREFLQGFQVSKKLIHELYMAGELLVDGASVPPHYGITPDNVFSVPMLKDESIDFIPQQGRLDIVFEDEHLLVVNKPAGILVHPDTKGGTGTLCNLVAGHYERTGEVRRVRYIHRLDIQTSGGIIFAKHFMAHSLLDFWLSKHLIKREYIALASGKLQGSGTINAPLAADRHVSGRRRAARSGDVAITHYHSLKADNTLSVIALALETGRTHQIRAHLAHLGHPLLGDSLYGGPKNRGISRHALHSWKITMAHPLTKKALFFEIPIPKDMAGMIGNLSSQ